MHVCTEFVWRAYCVNFFDQFGSFCMFRILMRCDLLTTKQRLRPVLVTTFISSQSHGPVGMLAGSHVGLVGWQPCWIGWLPAMTKLFGWLPAVTKLFLRCLEEAKHAVP